MAGHRVPVSPVAADDGTDEPVLVDGTDIGSVDKVDGPIGRNGHSFRIGQFAFASQSAAVELVARQTAFTGPNDRLPIAFRIRVVIEVPHADGEPPDRKGRGRCRQESGPISAFVRRPTDYLPRLSDIFLVDEVIVALLISDKSTESTVSIQGRLY